MLASQLTLNFKAAAEFNFENFVIADSNRELLAALNALNPEQGALFYLWGDKGSGRTHLLQAVCQNIESSVYIPLEKYLDSDPSFLEGLEVLPLVCLDDLDMIAGRRQWEESVFALFNKLRDQGHSLVVSACAPPREVVWQLADLQSRLSWGAVYHLHALNDTEKLQALRTRAAERGIVLSAELLNFIVVRSPRDSGSLFHCLDRLDELSLAEKRKITIPFVKQIMNW